MRKQRIAMLARASAVLATAFAVSISAAVAQDSEPLPPAPDAIPSYTGGDFGGLALNAPPVRRTLTLQSDRAWGWSDGAAQRLLLERDVRVTLGPMPFHADRALIWLEPIVVQTPDGQLFQAEQVAVYFDQLRMPTVSPGGVAQEGDRVLVTAVLIEADPQLIVDRLIPAEPGPSEADPDFKEEGEDRLAELLAQIAGAPPTLSEDEFFIEPIPVPPAAPILDPRALPYDVLFPDPRASVPPVRERVPVIVPEEGVVSASAPTLESIAMADGPDAIVMLGGVSVQYMPAAAARDAGPVRLSASRGVLFLRDDAETAAAPPASPARATDVAGVYLEGGVVATNGEYTLRGERVFYDPATDRAIALDAVFWTYDEQRGLPIYMRADAIRQLTLEQWRGTNVELSNVAFARPHFSVGASEVTITRVARASGETAADVALRDAGVRASGGRADGSQPGEGAGTRTLVDAENVRLNVGGVPTVGLPRVKSELDPSVVREIAYGNRAGDNVVSAVLDLYPIFALDPPPGGRAEFIFDGFLERGPGVGLDFGWSNDTFRGELFSYFIYDQGTDQFSTGEEEEVDDDARGTILGENAWFINDRWSAFTEFSLISDEAFIEAFFPDEAETRREYVTSLLVRYADGQDLLTVEARGTVNDFIANEYLAQSLGYVDQKLPEVTVQRIGADIAGILSYTGHFSVGRIGLQFDETSPRERGFFSVSDSVEAFGIDPDTTFSTELLSRGLTEDEITRVDSRHELSMPLRVGPVNVVPFAIGRLTIYDEDVSNIGGDPLEEDNHRAWGALGFRASTSLTATYDSIRSELFDLDRLRHIVEPSITFQTSGSNLRQEDLPLYDEDVESIATGSFWRVGARQTWQTKRGGRGLERSVDWLVVNTDFVIVSDDVDPESPFLSFDEARPERSQLADSFDLDWALQLTDATTVVGTWDYDFDREESVKTTLGARLDHGEGFTSFFEWRDLDAISSRRLIAGGNYEITRKYALGLSGSYSIDADQLNDISARVVRRFPQWTVFFSINFDNASDDVSASVNLRPVGVGSERRTRVFTDDSNIFTFRPSVRALQQERYDSGPLAP